MCWCCFMLAGCLLLLSFAFISLLSPFMSLQDLRCIKKKGEQKNQRKTMETSKEESKDDIRKISPPKTDHLIHYPFMDHFGEGAQSICYPFTNRYPTLFFAVAACLFGVLTVAFVLCQGSFTSDCRPFGSDLGDVEGF